MSRVKVLQQSKHCLSRDVTNQNPLGCRHSFLPHTKAIFMNLCGVEEGHRLEYREIGCSEIFAVFARLLKVSKSLVVLFTISTSRGQRAYNIKECAK